MNFLKQKQVVPFFLWVVCVTVIALTRPVWPTIETRAMSVAWEMLVRHDFMTMTLNFQPYSHKPPLLPWLINLFWTLFGVNKYAATCVPFLATAFSAFLTMRLAHALWPGDKQKRNLMPWLFFGTGLALLYGSAIFYDFLLVVFVALGALSLLAATQQQKHAWVLFGLSLGLGGLTKGPVILIHLLPLALLAPFWSPTKITGRWYGGVLIGTIIGFAIALAWAIPAAIKGGPEYAHMIFWGQSAGRMAKAFDHEAPFWFYFAVLPLFIVPWIFLKPFWKKIDLKNLTWQEKFLACWIIPVFILFSLISGKQIHYLLPILPAILLFLVPRLEAHENAVMKTTCTAIVLMTLVHIGGALTFFKRFDLMPIATIVAKQQDTITYIGRAYEGEFGYLGRLTHGLPIVHTNDRHTLKKNAVMCLRPHELQQWYPDWHTTIEFPYRGNRVCGVYEPPKNP